MTAVYVALAGAAGVLARYWISLAVDGEGDGVLWATVAINLGGSFALGLLVASGWGGHDSRLALGTGLLGGFTTYSTFSVQAVVAADDGRWGTVGAYIAVSVLGGIAAAAAGYALGRALRT